MYEELENGWFIVSKLHDLICGFFEPSNKSSSEESRLVSEECFMNGKLFLLFAYQDSCKIGSRGTIHGQTKPPGYYYC